MRGQSARIGGETQFGYRADETYSTISQIVKRNRGRQTELTRGWHTLPQHLNERIGFCGCRILRFLKGAGLDAASLGRRAPPDETLA